MIPFALLATIVAACPHAAAGCRSCGYADRAYAAPYAAPYVAPHVVADVKTIFIPSAQALFSETVGAAARQLNVEQAAAERVTKLIASLDALSNRIAQSAAQAAQPQAQQAVSPPAQPEPLPTPSPNVAIQPVPAGVATAPAPVPPLSPSSPGIGQTASSLDLVVSRMLVTDCKRCHTAPANGGGGYAIFNADGSFATIDGGDIHKMAKRIRDGSMPRGPKKYDAGEKELVARWEYSHADDIDEFIDSLRTQVRR